MPDFPRVLCKYLGRSLRSARHGRRCIHLYSLKVEVGQSVRLLQPNFPVSNWRISMSVILFNPCLVSCIEKNEKEASKN